MEPSIGPRAGHEFRRNRSAELSLGPADGDARPQGANNNFECCWALSMAGSRRRNWASTGRIGAPPHRPKSRRRSCEKQPGWRGNKQDFGESQRRQRGSSSMWGQGDARGEPRRARPRHREERRRGMIKNPTWTALLYKSALDCQFLGSKLANPLETLVVTRKKTLAPNNIRFKVRFKVCDSTTPTRASGATTASTLALRSESMFGGPREASHGARAEPRSRSKRGSRTPSRRYQ